MVVTGCGNDNGKGLAACFLLNVVNVKSRRVEINKVSLETRNIYSQRGSEKFTITSESRNLGCGCVRVCLFICLAPSPLHPFFSLTYQAPSTNIYTVLLLSFWWWGVGWGTRAAMDDSGRGGAWGLPGWPCSAVKRGLRLGVKEAEGEGDHARNLHFLEHKKTSLKS